MDVDTSVDSNVVQSSQSTGGFRSFADLQPKPIEWVWPNVLLRNKVNLLAGDTEIGKSTLRDDLAARLSVGGTMPDGMPAPQMNSLIISTEESAEQVILDRLALHGADMSRIFILDEIHTTDARGNPMTRLPDLIQDRAIIEEFVREREIDVIWVDPADAVLGKRGLQASVGVRSMLKILTDLAEQYRVTIVLVGYVRASAHGKRALDAVLARPELSQAIRLASLIWAAPEDDQHDAAILGQKKLFGVVKSNLGSRPPVLAFSRPWDEPIRWYGASPYDLDRLTTQPKDFVMTADRQNVLELIHDLGYPISADDVVVHRKKSAGAARKLLFDMTKAGLLSRVSRGRYDDALNPTFPLKAEDTAGNNVTTGNNGAGSEATGDDVERFVAEAQQVKAEALNEKFARTFGEFDLFDDDGRSK